MEVKTIYYEDELNDEFSGANITPRTIDENYKYFHSNIFWKIFAFLLNIVFFPIKRLYPKFKFRIEYVGKEKLKPYKNEGYFVYVNHTQIFADTFIPSNPIWPKKNYIIVNPENVSMKFLENAVQMLGAVPIPTKKSGMKNFLEAVEKISNEKNAITIYPEAHIWPYYTKIRPFKDVSFKYPVKLGKPTFCMTNTYQKRANGKVKIVTYIDGPFFPNENLETINEKKSNLQNQVYNCMVKRSKNSNYEKIKYVPKSYNL